MIDTTAVITAGGYGTRCGSGVPKSLLPAGKHTYLETLLIELTRAGINDVIVYCDRIEYVSDILMLSRRIMSTRVLVDSGVNSTFTLAKHSASVVSSSDILFCYGHAPRPMAHLKSLLLHQPPVVSVVVSTTKKIEIDHLSGGYVEPPYKLSVRSLLRSYSVSWADYFAREGERVRGIPVEGPGEFNFAWEHHEFRQYLASWVLAESV